MNNKNKLDRELIISFAILAMIAASGVLFVFLFIFGIDIKCCNYGTLVGFYAIIFSFIWGFLLCRNC